MLRTLILGMIGWGIVAFAAEQAPRRDLTLAEAVEKALASHPLVEQANARLRETEARISRSWSALFPSVSLEATVGTYHDRVANPGEESIPLVARDRNQYVGQMVVRQPIFHGFRLWEQNTLSHLESRIARVKLEQTKADVLQEVLTLYFEIQVKQQELIARKEALAFHEKQLQEIRLKVRQGRATQLDAVRAEYAAIAEKPRIEKLAGEIESCQLRLSQRLKLDPETDYVLADTLEQAMALLEEGTLPPFEQATASLLKSSPELRLAQLEREKVETEADLELGEHLPSLDALLTAGTNAHLRRDIATADTLSYGGELRLKIPLFSGLSSWHARAANRERIKASTKAWEIKRQELLESFVEAYRNWKVASLAMEASRKNVVLGQEVVSRSEQLYRVGRATFSDVLDGYAQFLDARRDLGDATISKIRAVTEIRKLVGWFGEKELVHEKASD